MKGVPARKLSAVTSLYHMRDQTAWVMPTNLLTWDSLRTGDDRSGRRFSITYAVRLGDVVHIIRQVDGRTSNRRNIVRNSYLEDGVLEQDRELEDPAGQWIVRFHKGIFDIDQSL